MRGQRQFSLADFSKGIGGYALDPELIAAQAGYLLDSPYAVETLNFQAGPNGSLRKRNGFQLLGSTPVGKNVNTLFVVEDPTTPYLVIGTTDTIYTSPLTSAFATTSRFTALSNNPWSFIQAPVITGQGPVYGMNGTDTPKYLPKPVGAGGTWTATAGSVPNGKYCIYHANRVWVAGVAANPARLHWSSLTSTGSGDPRNWSSTAPNDSGSIDLEPEDGDPITGIGTIGPNILVFKNKKTYLVYGTATDPGANRKVNDIIGCQSHRSIVETPAGVFFLSPQRGVFVTDGSAMREISEPVRPLFEIQDGLSDNLPAAYVRGHYYVSTIRGRAAGEPGPVFDYDFEHKSWWGHGHSSSGTLGWDAAAVYYGVPGNAEIADLFVAFDRDIYRAFDAGTHADNGVAFPYKWLSAWSTLGNPHLQKRVREIRVDADYVTVPTFAVKRAFNLSAETQTALAWEAQQADVATELRYYTPGIGRAWQFRLDGSASTQMEVFSVMASMDLRRD